MKNEIDSILDDLLASWHRHRAGYSHGRGFSGQDSTCRDHRTPTHWDWQNGAEEARAVSCQMKAMDVAVGRIPNEPQPWNLCLQFEARNLCSGATVWSSIRLPKGDELEVLRLEARTRLIKELHRDGLVG